MDWDEASRQTAPGLVEDLSSLSIAELEARIAAMEAEIVRIREELEAKRAHERAASALFKN